MIIGEVSYPDTKHPRKRIKCEACEISYSNKSYKTLIDGYKLLFLSTYSSEVEYCYTTFCHDCFFDNLNRIVKDDGWENGMSFCIFTKGSELELNFQPEDLMDEELQAAGKEVIMEDFIKDILES